MKELVENADGHFEQEAVYSMRREDGRLLYISITSGCEPLINAQRLWRLVASESADGDVEKWLLSIIPTCNP